MPSVIDLLRRVTNGAARTGRLAVFGLLLILEPLVRFVLGATAILSLVTLLVMKGAAHRPEFPTALFIATALGAGLALALYERLLQWLATPLPRQPALRD